jgi:hypothetical protein
MDEEIKIRQGVTKTPQGGIIYRKADYVTKQCEYQMSRKKESNESTPLMKKLRKYAVKN